MENKIFLKSKTIWGVLIAALPALLPALGVTFSADDTHMISQLGDAIFQTAGLAIAAYGRFVAKTSLSVTGS